MSTARPRAVSSTAPLLAAARAATRTSLRGLNAKPPERGCARPGSRCRFRTAHPRSATCAMSSSSARTPPSFSISGMRPNTWADALKALYPDKAKRKERLNSLISRLKSGGDSSIIGELAPHRERGEAAAKCIDYFEKNKERMRCDSYRERGMRIGSGIVESSRRHIVGLRLKLPGSRRTFRGANAMLSIKCGIANMRWVDFMNWKVKMPLAA